MKTAIIQASTLAKYRNWSPDFYLNTQSQKGANDGVTRAARRLAKAKKALQKAKEEHKTARDHVLKLIENGEIVLGGKDPAFMRWPVEKYYAVAFRVTNYVENFFQRSGCTDWPTFRQITKALKVRGLTHNCIQTICEDCPEGLAYNIGISGNGGHYEEPNSGDYTVEVIDFDTAQEHWTWEKKTKKSLRPKTKS